MNTIVDQKASSVSDMPTSRARIPDVPVLTHEGKPVRFYTDLVRDTVVLVNFFSIASHASNPVSTNLLEVAQALGPTLGGSVRMLTVTVDPTKDGADQLDGFARSLGAPPGWLFVTGAKADLDMLRMAFFRPGAAPAADEDEARRDALARLWGAFVDDPRALFCEQATSPQDCSTGLVRYGNDALGIWGSVPARARPELIVERISWLQSKQPRELSAPVRRGGPWPLIVS